MLKDNFRGRKRSWKSSWENTKMSKKRIKRKKFRP
jgi:hypothetical protein